MSLRGADCDIQVDRNRPPGLGVQCTATTVNGVSRTLMASTTRALEHKSSYGSIASMEVNGVNAGVARDLGTHSLIV